MIHFAGHVAINTDDSDRSIICCNDQESQGFYLAELLNLQINPKLVFLNGCESANGKINRGEGMLSPGLYFLLAGASGVIDHLWKAADRSSAYLATEFYRTYDGKDAPESLTLSKRKYLVSCLPGQDHPHYWAGIIYTSSQYIIDCNSLTINYIAIILIFSAIVCIGILGNRSNYKFKSCQKKKHRIK